MNKSNQAAGHSGFLQTVDGGRRFVLKPYDIAEARIYQQFSGCDDTALAFIPRFGGVKESIFGQDGKQFLCLEDLLDGFTNPKILDVKLGFRTFSESECECTKLRPELFKKMLDKFPEHLSAEERAAGAVTKHRWMTLRDANSTIASLGFRVDGWAGCKESSRADINRQLCEASSANDVASIFNEFAQMAATDEGQHVGTVCPQRLAEKIKEELQHMRHSLAMSHFVQRHEFVGTSALIIADAYGKVRVAWIDFAKTQPMPEGMQLTHTDVWIPGNHEDGFLAGLDGLVRAWDMASELEICLRSFSPQSWRLRYHRGMSRM
jgi:1D-myo-inositol-triphosphate 3-kinase